MSEQMILVLWVLAIGGSLVFAIKVTMLLVGLGDESADFEGEMDSSTGAFAVFSLQGLAILAMGFGWCGLAVGEGFAAPTWLTVLIAVLFSLGLLRAAGWLFGVLLSAENSGTLILERAVGEFGTIYLSVPEQGVGQVQVPIQGRLMTLDARSGGEALPTGTRVSVDAIDESGVLYVRAVKSALAD